MEKVLENEMLIEIRDLAKTTIASGNEPPATWIQLRELIVTVDAILERMNGVTSKKNLRKS